VELGPAGALCLHFDPLRDCAEWAPLATVVAGSASLAEAQDALSARGVHTELDYEVARAAEQI
jgi:hypothetical protein